MGRRDRDVDGRLVGPRLGRDVARRAAERSQRVRVVLVRPLSSRVGRARKSSMLLRASPCSRAMNDALVSRLRGAQCGGRRSLVSAHGLRMNEFHDTTTSTSARHPRRRARSRARAGCSSPGTTTHSSTRGTRCRPTQKFTRRSRTTRRASPRLVSRPRAKPSRAARGIRRSRSTSDHSVSNPWRWCFFDSGNIVAATP